MSNGLAGGGTFKRKTENGGFGGKNGERRFLTLNNFQAAL